MVSACRAARQFSLVAAAVLTLALFPRPALGARYSFQEYKQEDGLDNLSVRAILQDRSGFLWVATANGLFRYDGGRFIPFRESDGLPDGRIWDLHESSDGTLWVATSGGIAFRSGNHFERLQTLSGGTMGRDTGVATAPNGGIYFSTTSGLFTATPGYRGASPVVQRIWPAPGQAPLPAHAVHYDSDGILWFGCGLSLCRVEPGRVQKVPDPLLGFEPIGGIAVDRDNTLWVRTRAGVFAKLQGAARFGAVRQEMPGTGRAYRLYLDPQGRLAVPTQLGLYRWTPEGSWDRISSRTGLPADPVSCIVWDREGSPWLGMEAHGLVRWLGYGQWESWTGLQGLSTNTVTAVTRDGEGKLWVGTRYGLNRMESVPDTWRRWTSHDGLQDDEIRCMTGDPKRGVWVGADRSGLSYFDPAANRFYLFGPESGLKSNQIVSLTMDPSGTLWVPTRQGLFRAVPRGPATRFRRVQLPPAEDHETIYRVRVDRAGRIWMAGTRGLLRYDQGSWTRFLERDGLRHRSLIGLAVGPRDSLWVGYANMLGVTRFDFRSAKPEVTHFGQQKGLGSNNISSLETDRKGRVWIGTDAGVDMFEEGSWTHFDSVDGMVWPDCLFNAFLADPDGSVWIGTAGGLAHYRAAPVTPLPPPAVVLTSVRFANQTISPVPEEARRAIPYADRSLVIEFAALTYRDPAGVRFRYRLDEPRANWLETTERQVAFPSLPPGRYTFQVMASQGSGWSEPAGFSFRVLAPWWMTRMFRLGIALLFAGCTAYLWKFRVRRLMELKGRLEAAVRERTHQLERERDRTHQEKALVEKQKLEIERLLIQAREVNRLKDEFLANMSHEIRTPMNGVLGMTALALATELSSEQREYLDTVQSSARSLLQLLNEILDFSKIEAGRMELERINFSLNECVRESLKTLASLAREKRLDLQLQIHPHTPDSLIGDPQRIRQILLNLVSNAIKFTDRGSVVVGVRTQAQDQLRVVLHITVSDTGIGIPKEKLGFIFEPFRQADGSTTRKYGGTGLGLAICARLVKLMKGTMWVESEAGSGSHFHVLVTLEKSLEPISVRDAGSRTSGALQGENGNEPVRVLLVEDDAVSRRVASRVLEKRGYLVLTAENGREALEVLEQCPVELVLMDVQMPEVDGLTATRIIREREGLSGSRLPIYILTANAMAGDRERCLAAGADGYLTKPLEPAELFRTVEQVRARAVR